MEILIYAVFCVVVIGFFSVRWFWWILDVVADDLLNLFYRDEEKWWWEKELPKAIGRSDIITRAALNLLNEEGSLKKRVLILNAIRAYPQKGGYYPGMMLLVQLDNGSSSRKRKKQKPETVHVKRLNTLGQAPVYS